MQPKLLNQTRLLANLMTKGVSKSLTRSGDGALGGAIAEIDVDDTHGPEGAQCFGGGEVEACGLELFLDGTMEQEASAATKM